MILRLSSAKVGRAINSAIINEISAALLCWAEIKMCTALCCVVLLCCCCDVVDGVNFRCIKCRWAGGGGEGRRTAQRFYCERAIKDISVRQTW